VVQQWLKKNKTAVDESVEIKWAETTARRVIPVEQGWWNKSFAALDSWTGGLLGIGGKGSYKIVEAAAGEAEVLVARIGSLGDPEMYLRIGVEKKVDYVIVERQKEFLSNEKEFLIFDVNGMTGDARHLTLGQLAGKAQAFAGSHGMQVDSLEEAQQIVQLHSGINFKNRIPAFSETAITKGLKATRTSALVIEAIEQTGDALKDSGKDLWKKLWPSTSQESPKTNVVGETAINRQKIPGIASAKWTFDAMNPGPIDARAAKNFFGAKYNEGIVPEGHTLKLWKAGNLNDPGGSWFSFEPPVSSKLTRIDNAVKPQWINPETGVLEGKSDLNAIVSITLQQGDKYYYGPTSYQGGSYLGGDNKIQVYIPNAKIKYSFIIEGQLQ